MIAQPVLNLRRFSHGKLIRKRCRSLTSPLLYTDQVLHFILSTTPRYPFHLEMQKLDTFSGLIAVTIFTYAPVSRCCPGLLKVELPLAQDWLFLNHKKIPILARQRILCLTTHIHCVLNKYRGLYTWLSYFLDICWLSYFLGVDWLRYLQVINSLYVG